MHRYHFVVERAAGKPQGEDRSLERLQKGPLESRKRGK